jgi:homoserine kinase type II
MAVYTQVDAEAIKSFIGDCAIGAYVGHEGILAGVENTNYHLFTTTGRYILTIFEKRIDPADLPFVFAFTAHLAKAGLPVPDAICPAGTLAGKAAAIVRFLKGHEIKPEEITQAHCAQVGSMLARMHKASENFTLARQNPVGLDEWRTLYNGIHTRIDPELSAFIHATIESCEKFRHASLPRGAVHADLFPDNVFFDNAGKLSGVFDFYFACTDSYLYDTAITVNAWCLNAKGEVVPERLKSFAAAYETIRPFSAAEREGFADHRRAAALRILMTRLYDWVFTPAGAQVNKKDPMEYLAKLKVDCQWP